VRAKAAAFLVRKTLIKGAHEGLTLARKVCWIAGIDALKHGIELLRAASRLSALVTFLTIA